MSYLYFAENYIPQSEFSMATSNPCYNNFDIDDWYNFSISQYDLFEIDCPTGEEIEILLQASDIASMYSAMSVFNSFIESSGAKSFIDADEIA